MRTQTALVRAVFAIVTIGAAGITQAASWQQTATGTYVWSDGANWDTAFPNAAGAVANLDVGLLGKQTINLNQAIALGTLNVGDTGGTAGVITSISSGSGGKPLTFQGAVPGGATAINVAFGAAPASGNAVTLPDVVLGGTSPLTMTVNCTALSSSQMGNVNLNGNSLTLAGAPFTNVESTTSSGMQWSCNSVSGSGSIILNGSGLVINGASPAFAGSLTVNNGVCTMYGAGSLPAASQYVLGGAWGDFSKYPKGGVFRVGNPGSPLYTTVQDRLNHNAAIVFKSGFLEYSGQGLVASLAGVDTVEQVRQLQFVSGMSQIRMQDGNNVANSATLLANDPANACVRQPGATVMVGGDDNRSRDGNYPLAMGVGEKLIFASGMSQYLKGASGADGTMNKSIIPWMTDGTIYHPSQGRFVTYDNTNGLRCLSANEYYYVPDAGSVLGIDPTYNVCTTDRQATTSILNLGSGHTQTINSLSNESRLNSDIGAGSTLTVTSGAVHFLGPAKIGAGGRATAGTLSFGSAEGIIWTDFESLYGDNAIGSTITGTGGLTMAGNNRLILTGVNTYTGKTCVGSGIMQVGDGILTDCRLGKGDVDVAAGGTLKIAASVANAIDDGAIVSLGNNGDQFYGMMDLDPGISETIGSLVLNGQVQPAGTYGSSGSAATYKLDNYFTGTGMVTVTVPEPSMLGLVALGALSLMRHRK